MMTQRRRDRILLSSATACAILLVGLLGASPALAEAKSLEKHPGYVDGSPLIEIAGEESVSVQISIGGALLKALTSWNSELAELVGGLQSIQAVILDVPEGDKAERIKKLMLKTQRDLLKSGWQQLAVIRDAGSQVTVLVLNDDETIQGLVVLVADSDASEIVFTNVAGVIDLAALSKIGESMNIPGLEDLGD